MTRRDTIIQLICAGVLLLCVGASGVLSTNIASEAGKSQLVYSDRATEGDPPAVAYGIAMGAFRGLFVNYLWLRANRLKEEGKFHEAIQLSEAITTLQPRFPRVWAFHAWNMAYNISVSVPNADERWEWVKRGIELLRDDALAYNPNDVTIHKEIAWLYIHKIQGFMDDANRYYKRELAKEWTVVLGPPPELPDNTDGAKQTMIDWLRVIADAPNTLERVIEQEQAAYIDRLPVEDRDKATIPKTKVEEIVETVRGVEGIGLDVELLRLVAYYDAIQTSWYAQDQAARFASTLPNQEIVTLLEDPAYREAWGLLIPHVRKRVIIDKYKLQPLRMIRYTERYGPLDWRHPASHSIYWASKGVEETLERKSTTEKSFVNTDRLIVHSLQELFRSGTIFYDFLTDDADYLALYNLHYTDAYGDVLEAIIRPRAESVDNTDRAFSLYSQGYENFLREVVRLYYRLGDQGTARDYMKKLASSDWLNTNDPDKWIDLRELSLEQFVEKQLEEERFDIPYVARTEITAALRDGFFRGLLKGDRKKFEAAYDYAKKIHDHYKAKQVHVTLSDDKTERMEELPDDMRDVAGTVFLRMLTAGQIQMFPASRLYQGVPIGIQVRVYDPLARFMSGRGMAEQAFNTLFPEPPGIDTYREQQRLIEMMNRERDINKERDS